MSIENESSLNELSLNDVSGGTSFPPENPVGLPPQDFFSLPPDNPVGLQPEGLSQVSGGSEEEGFMVCKTCHKTLHSAAAIDSCRKAGHNLVYYPTIPG